MKRSRTAVGCLALALCGLLGVAGLRASGALSPTSAGAACGPATNQTVGATDGDVVERIYRSELDGPATAADRRQVETDAALLAALAEGNRVATHEAVVALVFSGTHIVRLRVSQNDRLLADVGGPYIVAPSGGNLYFQGRLVGSYLLSIQDDRGVYGLEKRLVGIPSAMHVGRKRVPINGTIDTGSLALPTEGEVTLHGQRYWVSSFNAKAYPSGTLRISLLHRVVSPSDRSCRAVRLAEVGRIGRAIWYRFTQDEAPISGFVSFSERTTGALTYVRDGDNEIAGSRQPGPPSIPASGTVTYRGEAYDVSSFAATTSAGTAVRVYQLVAPIAG